ncbi:MAG: translation elongation factor Ts [Pirellulales bacterium]
MAEITAALVRELRDETGLPMMDCKKALTECGGDKQAAKDHLRKMGIKLAGNRSSRETSFGRFGIYAGHDKKAGAIVEVKCESAPVAGSPEFIQFTQDLAAALANNPSVTTADELLALPSPSKAGASLKDVKDDMFNRIREVFNVGRFKRIDSVCGGYSHNSGTVSGVLVAVDGGNDVAAKDVAMHVAAMRPLALKKEEIDPAVVAKERELLKAAALAEGKPANIVDKMVEGRLKSFYAEQCLEAQPFVKENSISVGQYAAQNNMVLKSFVLFELGRE